MDYPSALTFGGDMMFSIERPYIFWGILWIIPLCLLVWLKFRKMKKSLGGLLGSSYTATTIAHLNHAIFMRTFLRVLSWVCVLLAAAGIGLLVLVHDRRAVRRAALGAFDIHAP